MMMHEAMEARKPGPQGERDMSVKTIMQGMPGDPAEPCMVTAASFSFCRRAMGAASFRHFPAPFFFEGGDLPAELVAFRPRRCRCVTSWLSENLKSHLASVSSHAAAKDVQPYACCASIGGGGRCSKNLSLWVPRRSWPSLVPVFGLFWFCVWR